MVNNFVTIMGNLTRDPERRVTSGGHAVANFSVAVNEKFVSKGGEEKERTTFVNVTAWTGMADKVVANFRKGDSVLVNGRLQTESWEKDGKTFSKLIVIAESLTSPFYPQKKNQPAQRGQQELGERQQSTLADDDVPF
jgi:single-strand DNA-binding protein